MTELLRALSSALAHQYRIERELGAGGMATVFLGHDIKHDRNVAIKVLKPELGAVIGAERFLREIKTTANLRHPHIVPLYDSGEVQLSAEDAGDGPRQLLYYVMPLVEGESLRDRLDREKQLPIEEAMRLTREVADALAYAHARGVVHRDIKPDNIMLESGHAVVADFGIARAVNSAGAEKITQTGISVGTPTYMSPEQAAGGDDVGERSDQYSLACMTFEMLGGQPPFTGVSPMAIARQHMIAEPPPISNLRAGVSSTSVTALRRALAKAPEDRFENISGFSRALASSEGAHAVPSSGRSHLRKPALITVGVVAVVLVLLFFWKRPTVPSAEASSQASSIAVLPFKDPGADKNNAYFGEGIAETLINALANVPGLSVTARTSSFAMRERGDSIQEIARTLHVANVLEGSVQRSGDQLRITAQVIRTSDGVTLWSQKFDRPAKDLFAVQDEVARAVTEALQLKLAPSSTSDLAQGGTKNPEAFEAYSLGRFHWNRRTTDGMIQATIAFKKAIAFDSTYALAWSGLADAYVLSIPTEYDVKSINPDSAVAWSEAAARRAIALAPRLGEAYASLGEALGYHKKYAEARAAFVKAVELSPNYATGHQWRGYELMDENQFEAGLKEMQIAHRLDPLSHVITLSIASALDAMERFDEATPYYTQGLAQSPEAWYAWSTKVMHELHYGRLDDAFYALGKVLKSRGLDEAKIARIESGIRNPATRTATIEQLGSDGNYYEALLFARFLISDDAAVDLLDRMARQHPQVFLDLYVYMSLSPKSRASDRVQAIGTRLGWTPMVR